MILKRPLRLAIHPYYCLQERLHGAFPFRQVRFGSAANISTYACFAARPASAANSQSQNFCGIGSRTPAINRPTLAGPSSLRSPDVVVAGRGSYRAGSDAVRLLKPTGGSHAGCISYRYGELGTYLLRTESAWLSLIGRAFI
jgi:hypothetical protein